VNEASVHLIDDGLFDFWCPMSGIRYEHAGAPIKPLIAILVIDEDILCAIPYNRRHSAHGEGLDLAQAIQHRHAVWMRDGGLNAAIFGGDGGDALWCGVEFFTHNGCRISSTTAGWLRAFFRLLILL
jgi:hypothetical protein